MPERLNFDLGRTDGYPTRYSDQHTAAHVDVIVAGLVTAILILAIGLLSIIPAYNSFMRKVLFCRIFCSLLIGGIILVGNYGHSWEKGVVEMKAPYKPGIPDEVDGSLVLYIALRGVNITLKGKPADHHVSSEEKEYLHSSPLAHERIDYNEHFSWEWAQGRFGFGKYAGRFSREFREAVNRGVPLPILQVAEYFTFDGEGIRFGRHYRLAGWYSHLILWVAFGTWLMANILTCMVIRTAALFLFLTGCLQLAAIGIWTYVRNFIELKIPFQPIHGKEDVILQTYFGVDYYLVLSNGMFCILLAGLITILDAYIPDEMCHYFGIDPLTIYDELLLSKDEIKEEKRRQTIFQGDSNRPTDIEMNLPEDLATPSETPDEEGNESRVFLRKRSNKASQFVRRSILQIKPRVPRRSKATSAQSAAGPPERHRLLQPPMDNTSEDEDKYSEAEDGNERHSYCNWPPPPTPLLKVPPAPPPKPKNVH